jgi:hypothetical protein
VVLAEVAAAAGQGVFVELHLGPAVITSHPRIVALAARACQAPAIDELFGERLWLQSGPVHDRKWPVAWRARRDSNLQPSDP